MSDMMTFPDTWEEFEKSYGFTDNEEVYTNGARLIPSFRVKQWLDHLPSVQQEQLDCEDCIKNGGDWECDRVHCHKGDVPDTNVGELIGRQEAIKAILGEPPEVNYPIYYAEKIRELPSAQPERTCVNCGRTVNNGGWYADGGTRCPIEEHYALPKDGYCHLWEKRNITDDDYPERREE